ncbi:hypothetical protein ILYODFUR_035173 [Ilyodon furcidens]|uniref:Secreted protein n=1 Tax=Ilyodon furcidens TaxID=33524 RepID=A0ABV0TEY7_9TELE
MGSYGPLLFCPSHTLACVYVCFVFMYNTSCAFVTPGVIWPPLGSDGSVVGVRRGSIYGRTGVCISRVYVQTSCPPLLFSLIIVILFFVFPHRLVYVRACILQPVRPRSSRNLYMLVTHPHFL